MDRCVETLLCASIQFPIAVSVDVISFLVSRDLEVYNIDFFSSSLVHSFSSLLGLLLRILLVQSLVHSQYTIYCKSQNTTHYDQF